MASYLAPLLTGLAYLFSAVGIGFGINAMLRPANALSFFELAPPKKGTPERTTVDALLVVYGVRDIFMGFAIIASGLFGSPEAQGCIILAGSAVAFVDGWVCLKYVGRGQGNHWGYAPVHMALGIAMIFGWAS